MKNLTHEPLLNSSFEEEEPVEDAFLQRYGGRLLGGAEAERSQGRFGGVLNEGIPLTTKPCLFSRFLLKTKYGIYRDPTKK